MKKTQSRSSVLLPLVAGAIATAPLPATAQKWNAVILPASLYEDRSIRLISEHTQHLSFTLQADSVVRERGNSHNITLEFDMPSGVTIDSQSGYFKLTERSKTSKDGRNHVVYDATIENSWLNGAPGDRVGTEWLLHKLFVNTPKEIALGQNFLKVNVIDGTNTQSFTWPLVLQELKKPAARPKRAWVGLWDYNFVTKESGEGIGRFLKDSGIQFTQNAGDETYLKALQKAGVVTGGNTHHAYFIKADAPEIDAAGNKHTDGFPDAQAVIDLPEGADIPGVDTIIKLAREGDGIATYDYEPIGTTGFSDLSVKAFRQTYKVKEADFKKFRDYVAKNGLQTHLATDPQILKMWKQWTAFRSSQAERYTRRIYRAVKAKAPEVQIAVTPSRSAGANTKGTIALGLDNAIMAQNTDFILPQIYTGYGGADAKLAMRLTGEWRREMNLQKTKSKLWPLLLVRYAGATPFNSPQRLFQQAVGSMANGADGITFYYPGNMDAPYWNMVARLNEDLALYEDYYLDGKRVDGQFKLSQLPTGAVTVNMYPGYAEPVENPGWEFTAHQLGTKILLTLINLEEANDLVFGIDVGKATHVSTRNAEAITGPLSATKEEQIVPLSGVNQWLVAPGQIAHIILERK